MHADLMPWREAVDLARREDVTEDEWRNLYYPRFSEPTKEQINLASVTARDILLRNGVITEDQAIEGLNNGRN